MAPESRVRHIFSVDVEEYFQVSAFKSCISSGEWGSLPSRVESNTGHMLEILSRFDTVGTFFVLGWIADRYPGLVRKIAAAGHEIASHGWWHRRVTHCSREEFREEVRSSKRILEKLTGRAVIGFRAPSFSIVPGAEWAFDILLEEGYRYDSSLFAVRRRGYGYPGIVDEPQLIRRPAGTLVELPLTMVRWGGIRLPAAGGGYFRQLPYELTRRGFRQHSDRGVSGVFYIHPWEIDVHQPRLPVSLLAKLRHYRGLEKTRTRLEKLLSEFEFTSVENRFGLGRDVDRLSRACGDGFCF